MNRHYLLGGAVALALLTMGSAADAQSTSVNQAVPWQFKDAATTAAQQNNIVLMEQIQNGYYKAYKNVTATLGSTGGTSLLGNGASATSNFTQIVNQTSNSCTASAAGASLTCTASGGGNSSNVGQTTTGSTVGATSTSTGNTVTNTPVTTNNQTQTNLGGTPTQNNGGN